MELANLAKIILLAPLIGSIIAGFIGNKIGRSASHWITILLVGISSVCSLVLLIKLIYGAKVYEGTVYQFASFGDLQLEVGFLLDKLSATMAVVVTCVSLMVHIYTIGYMEDDPGYQRFFSYISLFTFAMLALVLSNNFMQLFFGWEAVGLVSYLLIGFWFKKPSAVFANLKAFMVNRVGDFGFILGIGAVLSYTNSLNYYEVFNNLDVFKSNPEITLLFKNVCIIDLLCICLFIGAMGKSAQVPLHIWLPDSMEGPTPISALIHAATMVTAGVFMVARMSPLYELSEVALNFILVIGATTCFFMGILGLVQNDIKRVVAYSTLSQLGYMVTALGVSAYSAAIFHLVTHAFFKAVLFLGAGSVIIGMHHEQNIFKMGQLKNYMPYTYITMLLCNLALIGFPGFSGFFSKDLIIESVHLSNLPAAKYAYFAVLSSVFITALYSFRMFFIVFHGKDNTNAHSKLNLSESPYVVTIPLMILTVPAVVLGFVMMTPIISGFFGDAIVVNESHNVLATFAKDYHGTLGMIMHSFVVPPVYLALGGVGVAYYFYFKPSNTPAQIVENIKPLHTLLINKYGFDIVNERIFLPFIRQVSWFFYRVTDFAFIDGVLVNGSAKSVVAGSRILSKLHTGYLFHYVFVILTGVLFFLGWLNL